MAGSAVVEVGIVLTLLLVGLLVLSPRPRPRWHTASRDRSIAAGTAAALDALDRVEHRSIDVGAPWPRLVVGPSGVTVVEVCPLDGPVRIRRHGLHPPGAAPCPRCSAAQATAFEARRLLADVDGGADVPVRVLVVVPSGTRVVADAGVGDDLDAVPPDRVADRLVRGPVLPMALVDRAFGRLAVLAGAEVADR